MSEITTVQQAVEPGEETKPAPKRPRVEARPPVSGAPPRQGRLLAVVACLGLGALVLLGGLLGAQPVEAIPDPWHPTRVLAYALLLGGPAALFWAGSRALGLGWFWVFGAGAWAALGAVLIFVPPPPRAAAGPGDYLLVLVLGFLALVALFMLPLFWLNTLLAQSRLGRRDLRRPLRQAILLAFFLVGCAVMLAFGAINWLNILLLFTVLALAEFFFLART
jgi:hypothetical protein